MAYAYPNKAYQGGYEGGYKGADDIRISPPLAQPIQNPPSYDKAILDSAYPPPLDEGFTSGFKPPAWGGYKNQCKDPSYHPPVYGGGGAYRGSRGDDFTVGSAYNDEFPGMDSTNV